jgi:hypothetical protein
MGACPFALTRPVAARILARDEVKTSPILRHRWRTQSQSRAKMAASTLKVAGADNPIAEARKRGNRECNPDQLLGIVPRFLSSAFPR